MMNSTQEEQIKKYQLELQKNPNSLVFAPLAESYRKFGLIKEAKELCLSGIAKHPNYDLGHLVFAKIAKEEGDIKSALNSIEAILELHPENMKALRMGGELYLQSKFPQKALKCFKLLLFYNPTDKYAQKIIQKLETLTAADYSDDTFQMQPIQSLSPTKDLTKEQESLAQEITLTNKDKLNFEMNRQLLLADAYLVRNDPEKSFALLSQIEKNFGQHSSIDKRKAKIISVSPQMKDPNQQEIEEIKTEHHMNLHYQKVSLLQRLLRNIEKNKHPQFDAQNLPLQS